MLNYSLSLCYAGTCTIANALPWPVMNSAVAGNLKATLLPTWVKINFIWQVSFYLEFFFLKHSLCVQHAGPWGSKRIKNMFISLLFRLTVLLRKLARTMRDSIVNVCWSRSFRCCHPLSVIFESNRAEDYYFTNWCQESDFLWWLFAAELGVWKCVCRLPLNDRELKDEEVLSVSHVYSQVILLCYCRVLHLVLSSSILPVLL